MKFRKIEEPKLDKLNPRFSIGGLDPDEYAQKESWPGEESSLASPHFSRRDNDLDGSRKRPVKSFLATEKRIFPKTRIERTAELNFLVRQLVRENPGKY